MNAIRRFGQWLCASVLTRRPYVPTDDPEVRDLAERVEALGITTEEQDQRLSTVEARLALRNPYRWKRRDAG